MLAPPFAVKGGGHGPCGPPASASGLSCSFGSMPIIRPDFGDSTVSVMPSRVFRISLLQVAPFFFASLFSRFHKVFKLSSVLFTRLCALKLFRIAFHIFSFFWTHFASVFLSSTVSTTFRSPPRSSMRRLNSCAEKLLFLHRPDMT